MFEVEHSIIAGVRDEREQLASGIKSGPIVRATGNYSLCLMIFREFLSLMELFRLRLLKW